ncbi:SusC/RagA family TonB-linked outer membrane protein [Flammeovirga kamogawensis]|uniref:TonB-dependent receptor n=1 Tax=Flammeovirga kamogawensis TaxID=373891 RepID=A0ABX8H0Z0_9BACT|nr:TonB-dependent receptor [Flammeovirga kamogawensis]MBB6462236.1 TonB-linked SusC/RagA family outer membrane protein [Flammeovirga kamogawensis]QWG09364.1 TonB-dependent receptor [Flammeovirga kamogawensis]TRX64884.1 TonB-dependent receptor [Flammeovirga kamogawensis]
MKNLLLTLILGLCLNAVYAQDTVKGTIKSTTGEEVIGASVVIKGTTTGTITDYLGNFSLSGVKSADVLVVSSIGYIPTELTVQDPTAPLSIVLEEDIDQLEEVVVVGYGVMKKSDLTGSVGSIKSEDVDKIPASNPMQAMQGKVSGVQITSSSTPGGSPKVQIRGVGTTGDSNPLYVVDGMLLDDISFLSSNDVASMEVLKDASATAIYGSRGANGVVIITTKQGKVGTAKVSFSSYAGIQQMAARPDMVTGQQYAMLQNEVLHNQGSDLLYTKDQIANMGKGTDWIDEATRNAAIQNYQVGISGGSDKVMYNITAGYFNQEGIVKGSAYDRFNFRINNTYNLSKKVKVGHNISFSTYNSINEGVDLGDAYKADPTMLVYDENGYFGSSINNDIGNPMASSYYKNDVSEGNRLVGNVFLDYKIIEGLTFKTNVGFDHSTNDGKAYTPIYFVSGKQFSDISTLRVSGNKFNTLLWENTLSYLKEWGKHRINGVVGITTQNNFSEGWNGSENDVPNSSNMWYLGTGSADSRNVTQWANTNSYLSFLGRLNYSYNNKYLATATFRSDGSSRFGESNKFGLFPSLALGWRVSEEEFLQTSELISNLKLRASWGRIGNDKIGDYSQYSLIENNLNPVFGPDQSLSQGGTVTTMANSNLKWETVEQYDIGLEIGFWEDKLTIDGDYYYKHTKDMLVYISPPSLVGSAGAVPSNIGEVLNSGIDLNVTWNDNIGEDIHYTIGANISTINNEVLALDPNNPYIYSGDLGNGQNATLTTPGESIGSFYGYETAGVFQNQEQLTNTPHLAGSVPGDMIYVDVNNDGVINEKDKKVIGSPIPDFIYGVNLAASYKNFDLSVLLQGQVGNEIYNAKKAVRWGTTNFETSYLSRWTSEGTSNSEPRVTNGGVNYEVSDRFLENGSYLKLGNVTLGYSLSERITERIFVDKLRVYGSVSNIYLYQPYKSYSSEITANSPLAAGIDFNTYPLTATYTLGLNINF